MNTEAEASRDPLGRTETLPDWAKNVGLLLGGTECPAIEDYRQMALTLNGIYSTGFSLAWDP